MDSDLVLLVALPVGMGLILALSARRIDRRPEHRELTRRWRELDPPRRRAIRRALRRGEPVADPRDAEIAVAFARYARSFDALFGRSTRWLNRGAVLLLVLLAVLPALGGNIGPAIGIGAMLVIGSVVRLFARRARGRRDRAVAANERLLSDFRIT